MLWHSFHGTGVILNSNISQLFLERNSNIHCITFWVALLVYFFLVRCIENGFVSVCECKPLFFVISILSIKITSNNRSLSHCSKSKVSTPDQGRNQEFIQGGGASILFLSRGGLSTHWGQKTHWNQ